MAEDVFGKPNESHFLMVSAAIFTSIKFLNGFVTMHPVPFMSRGGTGTAGSLHAYQLLC